MSGFANKRSATTASSSGSSYGGATIESGEQVAQALLSAQAMIQQRRRGESGLAPGSAGVPSGILHGALQLRGGEAGNRAAPSGIVRGRPPRPPPWRAEGGNRAVPSGIVEPTAVSPMVPPP